MAAATQTQTQQLNASLFDSRVNGGGGSDSDEGEDLYEGTSSGAAHRNLAGARPLSVAALLETRPKYVPQEHTQPLDSIPYPPINIAAQPAAPVPASPAAASSTPVQSSSSAPPQPLKGSLKSVVGPSPFFPTIDSAVGWAKAYPVGPGLSNVGNTCFLNSALQVLIHTPPLVRYFESGNHPIGQCPLYLKQSFCSACSMAHCIRMSFGSARKQSYTPSTITKNLKAIGKSFRFGRQEDSHEFLRFFIDGMQKSELFGKEKLFGKDRKLAQEFKDSSWVHQVFGGRLRSRVTCMECKHPSDTFDSILDLSLDVQRAKSLKDALSSFVHVDQLRGANKYKCEECKKLVNAEKSFTIDQAPLVLTVHLKRFTPNGKKIGDQINYPDQLALGPFMSSRSQTGPSYRLYGVVLHSGGGPHSGHYTAYVKASNNQWHHMNDDMVTPAASSAPINHKSAYVLFYCREKGDQLQNAINGIGAAATAGQQQQKANGKRPRDSFDGNNASGNGFNNGNGNGKPPAKKAFIGPQPPVVGTASPKFVAPFQSNSHGNANGSGQAAMLTKQRLPDHRNNPVKISMSGNLNNKIAQNMRPRSQQRPAVLTS
ncbi:hypothetical protein RQP46_001984 [Phenoliferia psychrophenolica]